MPPVDDGRRASLRRDLAARRRSRRRKPASSFRSWSARRHKIAAVAPSIGLDISRFEIVDVPHSQAAAAKAVELIREGKGELLMKGSLHTDELMREVTSSETGLRTARRISHVFIMDVPTMPRRCSSPMRQSTSLPISMPSATSSRTRSISFTQLGLGTPRVAILSAVETVTPKIPSTIDAAALCKMADRGQITGGMLDGPLAFDNAIDPEAARIKGIKSPVAGRAQILVVPDLEAGNMLAKNLTFLARPTPRASCSARACRSSSPRARTLCARAWPPARWRRFTPSAPRDAPLPAGEPMDTHPRRQRRLLERQVPGVCGRMAMALELPDQGPGGRHRHAAASR